MGDGQAPISQGVEANPPEQAAENEGAESPPAAPVVIPELLPRTPDQKETTKYLPDQTQWWKTTLEVVALCVGVCVAIIYWHQLTVMTGQLAQMQGSSEQTNQMICLYRQQLAEMQRQSTDTHNFAIATADQALAVTQSQSAHFEFIKTPAVVVVNKPILVPIEVVNVGHSRATRVTIRAVAKFIPRTADPDFSYPSSDVWSVDGRDWDTGVSLSGVLMRKGSSAAVHNPEGKELSADENMVSDFRSGEKDVVLYGKITYVDVFGVKHWSQFCTVFQNFGEGTVVDNGHHKCTYYNQTDSSGLMGKPIQTTTPDAVSEVAPCPLLIQSKPN